MKKHIIYICTKSDVGWYIVSLNFVIRYSNNICPKDTSHCLVLIWFYVVRKTRNFLLYYFKQIYYTFYCNHPLHQILCTSGGLLVVGIYNMTFLCVNMLFLHHTDVFTLTFIHTFMTGHLHPPVASAHRSPDHPSICLSYVLFSNLSCSRSQADHHRA